MDKSTVSAVSAVQNPPSAPTQVHRTVTSLSEIPFDVGLVTLAEQIRRHAAAVFDHRYSIATLTDAERARHPLTELAYSAALSERALYGRWVVAVEALDAGASHEQVAAAMGLEAEELHGGLRGWAHGQLRFGHITPARHAEVLALLPEQATEAGGSDD